jgi:3-oxo-5-alpha-steroid 4-dehydrogenase 1
MLCSKYSDDWLFDDRYILGSAIFYAGFFGNIAADDALLALRKTCKKGEYRIPYGGMFEYVTAANYCEYSLSVVK